jgi:hypothetical protein
MSAELSNGVGGARSPKIEAQAAVSIFLPAPATQLVLE